MREILRQPFRRAVDLKAPVTELAQAAVGTYPYVAFRVLIDRGHAVAGQAVFSPCNGRSDRPQTAPPDETILRQSSRPKGCLRGLVRWLDTSRFV